MSARWSVQYVLLHPSVFVSDCRLSIEGVLLFTDAEFRLLHSGDLAPDENVALVIDDPLAAQKLREALGQPLPSGYWCFNRAIFEARTSHTPDGWVLHEVMRVMLHEYNNCGPWDIRVRPYPAGWDLLPEAYELSKPRT